jgi:hypothetical protein
MVIKIHDMYKTGDVEFVILHKYNQWGRYENVDGHKRLVEVKEFFEIDYKRLIEEDVWKMLAKVPVSTEKNWQNNHRKHDDHELEEYLENWHNYGVIPKEGGKIKFIDCDNIDLIPLMDELFKNSTIIKTWSGKRHYHVESDYATNHKFPNGIEYRAKNMYVVGVSCCGPTGGYYEIISDGPIKKMSKEEILSLSNLNINTPKPKEVSGNRTFVVEKGMDTSRSGDDFRKVISLIKEGKEWKEINEIMQESSEKWRESHKDYGTYTYRNALERIHKEERKNNINENQQTQVEDTLTEEESLDTLQISDLKYPTSNIPYYNELDSIINLQGDKYKFIKKNVFYYLVSVAVPESLLVIREGKIETDLRINNLNIMKSGKGKLEIKEGTKKILLQFNSGMNIKEMMKSHYQQLIGKVLCRKNLETKQKEYVKKMGFVFSDVLIFEECHELLSSNEKNDVDCRDVLTVALDIYGRNKISKQNIDNLDTAEETIEGYPHTRMMAFVQPLPVPEKVVTKGLARRMKKIYVRMDERTPMDKFVEKLTGKEVSQKDIITFADFLRRLNQIRTSWKLEKEAITPLLRYHYALLEQGFRHGGKRANYTEILEYPLLNDLLKYSALRAISDFRTNITPRDVKLAYVDLAEILAHELDYVRHLIIGDLDYGERWSGATGKDAMALEFLNSRGATSFENSNIGLAEFKEKLKDIYKFSSERTANRILKRFDSYVDTGRKGTEWFVWLKVKVKEHKIRENTSDINPIEEYGKAVQELEEVASNETEESS